MNVLTALAFALNIFAMMSAAESHEKGEGATHYAISVTGDFSKAPVMSYHPHAEKCGVAACAIALPAHFSVTTTTFGTKIPFDVSVAQLTSLKFAPPSRPPKI